MTTKQKESQQKSSKEEVTQLILQEARKHLISFCIATDPRYEVNWHLRDIAEKLEAVERGEIKRLMLFLPPRHGKSELASINFPAWYLGRNPEKEVITASYSADLATDFGAKTRDKVKSDYYQAIFPKIALSEDRDAKGKWNTSEGGGYTSAGVGGPITGRGANLLLLDDLIKNREEADSEVYRKKVWEWLTSTAYTRLNPQGAVVLTITRWHEDDIAGRLRERMDEGGEQWTIVEYPAIAEDDEKFRKKGEALWSQRYPLSELENIRRVVGEYDWQSLFQQHPIAPTTREFHPEWFRYWDHRDIDENEIDVYAMVDLAIGKGTEADNSSIQVIGKRKDSPNIYRLEENTGHLDPGEVIEYLFYLKNKYRFHLRKVGIESVAYQKSLLYFLNEEMKKRQEYFDVVELRASGAKEMRIRGLIPMYRAGVIFHKAQDETTQELERELITFPSGKHDDRIDALAYLQQILEHSHTTEPGAITRQYIPDHKNNPMRK